MNGSSSSLFNYQKDGVDHIHKTLIEQCYRTCDSNYRLGHGIIFCDEMGLGKTLQTLSVIMNKFYVTGKGILVVCPASLIRVWKEEIGKHFSELGPHVVEFEPKKKFQPFKTHCPNIVLTSYNILINCYHSYIYERLDSANLSNEQLQRLIEINPGNPNRGLLKQLRFALDHYTDTVLRGELINIAGKIDLKQKKDPPSYISGHILFEQHWSFLVGDEIHKIKSSQSQSCRTFGFLISDYRIVLSGTPVMNSGNDLLNILKYGLAFYDLDWEQITKYPNGSYCQDIIDKFTFGRKKQDIEELKDILPARSKEEECVMIEWSDIRQVQVYRQVKQDCLNVFRKLSDNPGLNMAFFQMLQKCKQVCVHWDLPLCYVPEEERKYELPKIIEPSPKMLQVKALLDMYPNDKLICFSSFKEFLKQIMKPWLKQLGIKSAIFHGASKKEQDKALKSFHENEKVRVLLIVKQAGSEGLNLQKAANLCVIMDPHFNKAGDEQACQRIDRIGQEKEVIVRKLFMKGSIDEALLVMQQNKEGEIEAWRGKVSDKKRTLETQGLFLDQYDRI